jgi:hypothetical protein
MSQGNAAARKRRAGGASFEPAIPQQQQQQQKQPQSGLTLPQVISLVDARLIKLETFMKETRTNSPSVETQNISSSETQNMDEFDEKFEILANEIADLKDIVIKLQSYTMEVNKMLMEDRIAILSDIDEPSHKKEVTFDLQEIDSTEN